MAALKEDFPASDGVKGSGPVPVTPSFSTRWAKSFPTLILSSEIQFSCMICKKGFRRKCDLNRHHKKHTRPYNCECGKRFASRKDRDRHSNIWDHGQKTNYLCTISSCLSSTIQQDGLFSFGRVDRWRTHMIKKHGLSKEEVQAIVKKGIPMEMKKVQEPEDYEAEDLSWYDEAEAEDSYEFDEWNEMSH